MGRVLKYTKCRQAPRTRRERGPYGTRSNKRWSFGYPEAMVLTLAASIGGLIGVGGIGIGESSASPGMIHCSFASVTDGDTFRCGNRRIRLQGIDAPEMPGHCRKGRSCAPGNPYESTENLRRLLASGDVKCRKTDTDRYGRTVARCTSNAGDLSCKQLEGGYAIRRYGQIAC